MIHYHGTPITPEIAAAEILRGRHAMVSFANPEQIGVVAEVCQSFVLDNGAFSAWTHKRTVDWAKYIEWVAEWELHPGFDWALIPDAIDGDESANDKLLDWWMDQRPGFGVPVWHLHESLERLESLARTWPRVALGSSKEYAQIGTRRWWKRMDDAMCRITEDGRPITKLHGLRMLDPKIFGSFPFASADSTNIALNIGRDSKWKGTYQPPSKAARGIVMAERIEAFQSAETWEHREDRQYVLDYSDSQWGDKVVRV